MLPQPNQFTVSIWGDEGFSAILSMKSIPEIIKIIAADTSPPLYNITEHVWFQIFGSGEVAIRSLSFLYYVLTIFFVYKIGAFLFDRKTGILGAILSFLNPFFFIYAFEGRMYSILALGVTASMYFFLTRRWVGYIIATTWAMYSHHFAIFALFLQGIWFLKEIVAGDRKTAISMFKALIVVCVLYLPWVIPLYNQTKMVGGGFWLGTPTLTDLRNLIYEYLAQGIKHSLAQFSLWIVFVVLLIRNWTKNMAKTTFLVSWFLFPIIATWAISQHFQSIFYNRYLLYAIPGAMLVLASNKRYWSTLPIILLLGSFMAIDWYYFTHPIKRPFKELSAYVLETKRGDDFLINWNSASHHLWETKYYQIPAPIYIPGGGELPFFVGTALMEEGDIINELPKQKTQSFRIGVVTSGSVDEITIPGYTVSEVKDFGQGLKFIWFSRS